jgi:hypothetical protein
MSINPRNDNPRITCHRPRDLRRPEFETIDLKLHQLRIASHPASVP